MHSWLQAAAEEVEVDTRDWRARTGGDHAEGMANGGAAPAAPAPQAQTQQQVRLQSCCLAGTGGPCSGDLDEQVHMSQWCALTGPHGGQQRGLQLLSGCSRPESVAFEIWHALAVVWADHLEAKGDEHHMLLLHRCHPIVG